MASEESATSRPRRPEPELETVPLARITRKTVERLAPFCQMRLPIENPNVPLVPKTNSKILGLIQAVDTSMLVAQIGYKLASDAASLCDPFAPPGQVAPTNKYTAALSTPEMLQTMAAHGHGHCLKTSDTFKNVQQEIFKIAAVTKDKDTVVLVPPDPQQPATRRISLKEVGTDLVANLNLLNQFSRSMLDLTSWWEWLEEELMSPDSTLLPSTDQRDAELYARWSKIKGGYLDYYNTIRVVYTRYPQLLTTSSAAWQSISSVPRPPSAPGSSWDGSFQDLGAALDEVVAEEAQNASRDQLRSANGEEKTKDKAKSVKSIKSVKALVGKIGFVKVFSRKKGGKTKGKSEEGDKEGEEDKEKEEKKGKKDKKDKRDKGDKKDKEDKRDKGDKKDKEDKEDKKEDKKKEKEKAEKETTEETPVIDVLSSAEQGQTPPPVQPPVVAESSKKKEDTQKPQPDAKATQQGDVPAETEPQPAVEHDRESRHSSRARSSSTSSTESNKGGVAKVLAALKEVFAKLGCRGDAEIEN